VVLYFDEEGVMINFVRRLLGLHVHDWGMLEPPHARVIEDRGENYAHIHIPPSCFTIVEQRQRCLMCGRVRWVRIE
jgi:hypothetical protein